MTDADTGLVADEPAGDVTLDSIISSAMDKAEAPADQGGKPPPEPPAVEAEESDGRPRDERGRFVPKDTVSASEKSEPAEAAQPAEVKQPDPAQEQPIEAPARWTEADKAKFAAWPRDVQAAVVERHKAMEADYTRKTQDIAEFRKSAEPLLAAVQPFQQYLNQVSAQLGTQPASLIGELVKSEYALRTGTADQKAQALATIAASYGIDLAALSRGQIAQPDPLTSQLRQQVSQLSQNLNTIQSQIAQDQQRQLESQISAFSAAKDDAGQPKHPHFERVKGVMAQLLQSGEVETLEAAYEKATAPIREAVALELAQRQQADEAKRKEALEKAKRAAPVKTGGTQPNGQLTGGSDLDSIISGAMARAGMN